MYVVVYKQLYVYTTINFMLFWDYKFILNEMAVSTEIDVSYHAGVFTANRSPPLSRIELDTGYTPIRLFAPTHRPVPSIAGSGEETQSIPL
jgi:hypothetical protein